MARYIVEITDNFLENFRVDDDGKTKVLIVKDLALANRGIKLIPTENVQPIIHCKDCKYWKDSDGVYRRGFDAESKCPINIESVYNGTFYCARAEKMEESGKEE